MLVKQQLHLGAKHGGADAEIRFLVIMDVMIVEHGKPRDGFASSEPHHYPNFQSR